MYLLLMILYLYGWVKTPSCSDLSPRVHAEPVIFVSILIPARNEEQNILRCLSAIYQQEYSLNYFEIIVIDDHSADNTPQLVESQQYQNLRIIRLRESQSGKKQALTEGVRAARGSLIITTDADCEPGEKWLSEIISFYKEKRPKMIVAPVLIGKENGMQQIMQFQEMTVLTACACASLYWNRPILCSGANLAFEKNAFMEVNGFDGVTQTATGDDIFLMLKINKKFPGEIAYLKSKDAIVVTYPESSFSAVLRQRKRWASKSFSYGHSHVTWIAILVFLINFIILFSGILSAINIKFVLTLVISFSAKFVVDLMLLHSASSFFKKGINYPAFAVASVIYPLYVSLIGIISPVTDYSWKGRKL